MSALPNSKSSLLYATRSCSALALAGAIILPLSPAIAQNATADTPVAAGSQSDDRVRENPADTSDEFYPHLGYHSLKNTVRIRFWNSRDGVSAAKLTPRRVSRLLCERWV